jgi:hypothetical protein
MTPRERALLEGSINERGSCAKVPRGSMVEQEWRALVEQGLAYCRTDFPRWGLVFFAVTQDGMRALGLPGEAPQLSDRAIARDAEQLKLSID